MAVVHYVPFGFDRAAFASNIVQPSTEKYFNNVTFIYFERCLFQRCTNVLDFTLPANWTGPTLDFFLYTLFRDGYCAVFNTERYGVIFQPASLGGQGVFYQPTWVIVSNPMLPSFNRMTIGGECEILKLTPDYRGIFDVISYYAEKLSLLAASIDMTLINSRVPFIAGAKTKAAANSLKMIVDKLSAGQSTIITDAVLHDEIESDSVFDFFDRTNVKNGYLGQEFMDNYQALLYQFDQEIGIPTPPSEKNERMIPLEVTSKVVDTTARASLWMDTFNSSAEDVNSHFELNISCKYKYENYGEGVLNSGLNKSNS